MQNRTIRRVAMLAATLVVSQHVLADQAAQNALVGASVSQFFIEPGTASKLTFKAAAADQLKYAVTDYWGNAESTGEAVAQADGRIAVTLNLPIGYHELRFVDRDQTFGVVAMPAHKGAADPFFGIDAALSWLDTDTDARNGMLDVLQRSGIAFARERMGWGNVNPSGDQFDFETKRNFDSLRKAYADRKIAVLDMIDGPPAKFRSASAPKNARYPDELGPAAAGWETIAKRFAPSWGGLEVSNEPELSPWPADQYVPMVKMTAYAQQQAGLKTPIGGGVFGGNAPSAFHDVCLASGMLDSVDFISFHTYDHPNTLAGLVEQYRAWLAKGGKASMPLWLTEAGRPWTIGPARPPISEDTECAVATTSLTTEARALGVARICPFVLPYYNEGGLKSFSMMGKERSPLRILAGYVNAVRVLSGKAYAGDIANIADASSVRVFGDGDEQLIVIRTPAIDAKAIVQLNLPVTRVEGIDGRPLTVGAGGAIPVPDGVAYAWASKSAIAAVLKTDTPAAKLFAISQQAPPTRGLASPIVLQHPLAGEKGKMSPRRYLLDQATAKALPLNVRVDNMGDAPQTVTLTPKLPGTSSPAVEPKTVTIPALGHALVDWTVDASTALDMAELRFVTVTGQTSTGEPIAPLAVPYQTEGELADHLARNQYQLKLPITDLSNWQPNIVGHGTLKFSQADDALRFDVAYTKPGERWAYPRFVIRDPIDASRARGVLMRARILKPSSNVAIMVMQSGKPGFWAMEVFPADGKWHVCYVPFNDLVAMPGNPDMQNSVIDPAKFTGIQVGMKSVDAENAMEVSDLLIVGPK